MITLHDSMPDAVFGTKVRATFHPTITETLRPGALLIVGSTLLWSYGWPIDEDDSPYCGMIAWTPPDDLASLAIGWVPACDLLPIDADMLEHPI